MHFGLRFAGWVMATALVCAPLAVSGQQRPASTPVLAPEIARQYVVPHEMVDIGGGRRLNLFCMGNGARTVLFDSGASDWSVIWALVQPALAADARVCTYDRAGLGYSDQVPGPRSPIAIVEDLHELIRAARLDTPLILVGHSLGGFNVKLYTAMYPEDVAGLVLVDPSEERNDERVRALITRRLGQAGAARKELSDSAGLARLLDRYRNCAEVATTRPLDPAAAEYRQCSDPVRPPLGPEIAAERQRLQVTQRYQQAQASEYLNSVYGDNRFDGIYARLFRPGAFGNRPMIVLSHGIYDRSDANEAADYEGWLALHQTSAGLSRRGRHRVVPNTHHNIEIDDPQSIVDAVREVLRGVGTPATRGAAR